MKRFIQSFAESLNNNNPWYVLFKACVFFALIAFVLYCVLQGLENPRQFDSVGTFKF